MNVQLVNNRDARCPDLEDEVWQEIIQLVLTGTFYCCKHVSRAMFRTKGGSIILTATVDALIGQAGLDAYSAAKGGVIALTRSLAAGVAADGIRVNAICPGFVRTEAQRYWMDDAIAFQSIRNMHLLEVPGPDEIASFAAFLASDLAKAMTGGIHPVDAGYLAFKGRETMNLIQQNKPKDISDSSMGRTP